MLKLLSLWILLVSVFTTSLFGDDLFNIRESIIINRPIEKVFNIAGNTIHDSAWRSEVHIIHSDGDFAEGTRYIEDAKLGIHQHYFTQVELVNMDAPYKAIYITINENPFYLKSSRLFERLEENRTKFTYDVDIEKAMIKDIVGVQLPISITRAVYSKKMKKYLKKLKISLEKKRKAP